MHGGRKNAAADQSHDNRPQHHNRFTPLQPRCLTPEKKFSQHGDEGMVWFDTLPL